MAAALATSADALDNVCTAELTKDRDDFRKDSMYAAFQGPAFPDGVDLHNLAAIGPHCDEEDPTVTGYDQRCCATNKGTADHTDCKNEQEAAVKQFLSNAKAIVPLTLPFVNPFNNESSGVFVSTGYYKKDDSQHRAIDFAKSGGPDPGFPLYAPAPATVVFAEHRGGTIGNEIVLRHEAPNGSWLLTTYRHVRGGRAADMLGACPCIDPAGTTSVDRLSGCPTNVSTSCKYAANPANDHLWGTDDISLPAMGRVLARGERFSMAGNTGTVRLDSQGMPTQPGGNTHLHFTLFVPRPDGANDADPGPDVVVPDPYGVYSKKNGSLNGKPCYAEDAPSTYSRYFAPHLPRFHDVPYTSLTTSGRYSYYPDAGWGPQSIQLYNKSGKIMTAGAFDPRAPRTKWWMNASPSLLESKATEYTTLRVRQLSVRLSSAGPKYTAIWEHEAPGEESEVYLNRSPAEFDKIWKDKVVNGPYGVVDHFVHISNGVRRHSWSLGTAAKPFHMLHGQTAAQISATVNTPPEAGYKPVAVSATEGATGAAVRFSIVLRQVNGDRFLALDMNAAVFQAQQGARQATGWRLVRSQGYDNGTRFLGLWEKCGNCPNNDCRDGVCAAP